MNNQEREIRCLCYRHMRDYRNSRQFIVRRTEVYSILKEKCDWCNRFGFEYLISERKNDQGGIVNG